MFISEQPGALVTGLFRQMAAVSCKNVIAFALSLGARSVGLDQLNINAPLRVRLSQHAHRRP